MITSVGEGAPREIGADRGSYAATITAVTRQGPDLVLHVKDGVRSFYRSMYGAVVFVDAGPVQSTDLRDASVEQTLEPGWKFHQLKIAGDAALLEVRQSVGMSDSTIVAHRIPCAAVRDDLRVSIGKALLQLLRT